MKNICRSFLLIAFFSIAGTLTLKAQTDPGDPGDDPDRVPLDPGSWVLVAAGVGYGAKKWRDEKRMKKMNVSKTIDYIQIEKNDEPYL